MQGEACFGDDDDIEQYLHTLARTHYTLLQKLGFRGLGEPLPLSAGFVFDVYAMLRFRF